MGEFQANRVAKLTTPAGEDRMLVKSVQGTEGITELFRFEFEVSGDPQEIKFEEILGQPVALEIDLAGDRDRWVHGIVTRLIQTEAPGAGKEGGGAYLMEVRPWPWLLTQRKDCRIFQETTIPDIVKQVFDDRGFSDYELKLSGTYDPLVNCVQYQESDWDFVARLLEQEGIFYYFIHEESRHVLVMCDSVDQLEPLPGADDIEIWHGGAVTADAEERINTWEVSRAFLPGKYAMTDYNFQDPTTDLAVDATSSVDLDGTDKFEIFEYPGDYVNLGAEGDAKLSKGDGRVRLRQEEGDARYTLAAGTGTVRAMIPGYTFSLAGHSVEEFNQDWLLVKIEHEISEGGSLVDDAEGDAILVRYVNRFRCVPASVAFRPRRKTPLPRITGPQTAVVVGPSGEELYVDKFGRVKVQFHWDRYGEKNEKSSCWVRVSQHWAGKGWGTVYHPRIGQEVIVEFLEGNPDRPLITGRVYNGANPIPYTTPTQSGILTRSSKEGTAENANELRFEDNKGSEEVYFHAEKDMNRVVENNDNQQVGAAQSITVGAAKTVDVAKAHSETIGEDMGVTIGGNRAMSVAKDCSESIGGAQSTTVGKNLSETVGETRSVSVGKSNSLSVGKSDSKTVGAASSLEVGKSRSVSIADGLSVSVGTNTNHDSGENHVIKAKKIAIEAKDELVIKVGKAKVEMKKNGDIKINGKKINLKGSGDIVIKGSKVTQN